MCRWGLEAPTHGMIAPPPLPWTTPVQGGAGEKGEPLERLSLGLRNCLDVGDSSSLSHMRGLGDEMEMIKINVIVMVNAIAILLRNRPVTGTVEFIGAITTRYPPNSLQPIMLSAAAC